MAVEKALVEEREGFRRGGSRRGGGFGRRSGKAGRSRSRAQRRSKSRQRKGPRSRGVRRTQKAKTAASTKAAENQGFGQFARRQRNIIADKTVTPQQAAVSAAPEAVKKGLPDARDIAKVDTSFGDERDAFNKATGFQTTGGGFLRDSEGNIVRSKTQVDRFREEKARERALRGLFANQIQAEEAKQVTPTFSGLQNRLAQVRDELGKGKQTPENLRRLVDINRQLGDFDYAGMGLGNQFRTQGADLIAGIPGLAKVASAVAGGPLGIAGLVASGGRGIGNLVFDALGRQQSERQPNLAESQDDAQGGLQSLLAGLRIGEGAPFVEDRGGRQDERVIRTGPSLMSPPPTTDSLFGKTIKKLPITTQPVDTNIMNQYLALAGFSPQEIQGMPSAFRFLG